MSWILDTFGVIGQGPMESPWWSMLRVLSQASRMALAGAYLVVIARFLRLWVSLRENRTPPESFRQISALLGFCALAHAGDAVATFLTSQGLWSMPSVLGSLVASLAAVQLARMGGSAPRRIEPIPLRATVLRVLGPSNASRSLGAAASSSAVGGANAPTPRDRREWARLRIARMEDMARRNAWLSQRREAVERLGAMLTEPVESWSPGPAPSANGRAMGGESTERGGTPRLA